MSETWQRYSRKPTECSPHLQNVSSMSRRHEFCKTVRQFHKKPVEAQGDRRYSSYSLTTLAVDGGVCSASRPCCALPPGERPPHWIGGWVGPSAGLDSEVRVKILCLCRRSNLDCPVVQSVTRHYTDWATPAPLEYYNVKKLTLVPVNPRRVLLGPSSFWSVCVRVCVCVCVCVIDIVSMQFYTLEIVAFYMNLWPLSLQAEATFVEFLRSILLHSIEKSRGFMSVKQ
jgi:hypothetical protein